MEVIVAADRADLDARGTAIVVDWLGPKRDALVVPALGNSPLGVYSGLAAARASGAFDSSALRVAQLDEYHGIAREDPRRLRSWLERDFITPLGIDAGRVIDLPSDATDVPAACEAYSSAVRQAGGIDVAILGLGPNGHLGFNEPPSGPDDPTRAIDLAPESIASGAAYFGSTDQVPRRALTCGMDLLLSARRVLLLVTGSHKRDILARVLTGPVSAEVPASLLQTIDGVTVLADRDARPSGATAAGT
jgi:glucosamine-6-phosphate deaminase